LWPAIHLLGYRDFGERLPSTYVDLPPDGLPPIERDLDDELRWLLREPPVEGSLQGSATLNQLDALLAGQSITLPRSFASFMASDGPRARARSCTDSYLRLPDFAVRAGEGWLINFLADSQSVIFWLLYTGRDGEAVVATENPPGFEFGDEHAEEKQRNLDLTTIGAFVCADSFSEFLYRFWIENEIFFRLQAGDELTSEQRRYAEHYSSADHT
jgi:hypothetical protein